MSVRFLTIRKFSEKSGYTEDAVRTKIHRGIWLEGEVWKKAPDGRQLIDVKGFELWVETGGELGRFRKAAFKSPSLIGE